MAVEKRGSIFVGDAAQRKASISQLTENATGEYVVTNHSLLTEPANPLED